MKILLILAFSLALPLFVQDTPKSIEVEKRVKIRIETERYEARHAELLEQKAIAEGRKAPRKPEPRTDPVKASAYYLSWDDGEIKECETFSGEPNLLTCDPADLNWKDSFINIAGTNAAGGMSDEESYHTALLSIRLRAKTFMMSFSEQPWPSGAPIGELKMIVWECTKDKAIACNFAGRGK